MKRTALITGASSGLGKTIAEYYLGIGDDIMSLSRRGAHWDYDLRDSEALQEMIFDMTGEDTLLGRDNIDVLINNAGALILDEKMSDATGRFNLLLHAPYLLIELLAERINKGGHIINIASVSGMKADTDTPMYGALKAGLISLTKSYARKLAPDVRVNCISPGFFKTNLVPGDLPQELLSTIPLGKEAEPKDIIPVVQMLDESEYITGANIVIDGGVVA